MKTSLIAAVALTVIAGGSLRAEGIESIVDGCCVCGGGWDAGVQVKFLRFHVSGGVTSTAGEEFDLDATPEVHLGYTRGDGLGARVRYWQYDHDNGQAAQFSSIQTYNLDFEVYQRIALNCDTNLEVSGGLRYNDLEYNVRNPALTTNGSTHFDGIGVIMGVKLTRDVCFGTFYGDARYAILMDDVHEAQTTNPTTGLDHTYSQTELEIGIARTLCFGSSLLTFNAGVEVSNWNDALLDGTVANGGSPDVDPRTLGFGGFVLGLTVDY